MKYIVHPVQIDTDNFTYKIEPLEHHVGDNAGMANAAYAGSFLPTKEVAIAEACRLLRKAGLKDEDIIIQ